MSHAGKLRPKLSLAFYLTPFDAERARFGFPDNAKKTDRSQAPSHFLAAQAKVNVDDRAPFRQTLGEECNARHC